MRSQSPLASSPQHQLAVELRSAGEWIVGRDGGDRRLHVYRLGADDWLISEVGRQNEGRGANFKQALIALAAVGWPAEWAAALTEAVAVKDDRPTQSLGGDPAEGQIQPVKLTRQHRQARNA